MVSMTATWTFSLFNKVDNNIHVQDPGVWDVGIEGAF